MLNTGTHEELVSIVMPSLNQAAYIERAINSVLDNDGVHLELIVMDGGSTDGTLALLSRIAEKDQRVKWTSEPDKGAAHAINKAMLVARGEYLGWLNADDIYTQGAINRAVSALKENAHWKMVYGHGQHIDEGDRHIDRYPTHKPDVGLQKFADGCFICQPTVFLRSLLLKEIGPLDENLRAAFDFEWWMRILAKYPDRVGFVDAIQAKSRLHEEGITFTQREAVISESMQIISLYLGACPLHWYKTYVHEMLTIYQQPFNVHEVKKQLEKFSVSVAEFLNVEDRKIARNWLGKELAKVQAGNHGNRSRQAGIKKLTESVRGIAGRYRWPGRGNIQIWKLIKLIRSSGLFDEAWYLAHYKDVGRVGVDPVEHYLRFGAQEGRNPSSFFNTRHYLERNPVIIRMGINPLVHFIIYGRADANRIDH